MDRLKRLGWVVVFGAVFASVACSSESPSIDDKACVAGESKACTGPAACSGYQVCKADGSAFDACQCGTGGTGGTAADGGAGQPGDGGPKSVCPAGLSGPALMEVKAPNGKPYCVDATEVTFEQYDAFIAAKVGTAGQQGYCAPNTNLNYDTACMQKLSGKSPNAPAVCVDWCDADVYCKWAGKRLCGAIGGGASDYEVFDDPAVSQWFNACSSGGKKKFAYGDTLISTCDPSPIPWGFDVLSRPECAGGFPGLHGMSSNVSEWEAACEPEPSGSRCVIRGFDARAACAEAHNVVPKTAHSPTVGFRCCHDGVGAGP
ncbi:MAG TPA: SUMF1/EgtB/PvdO family nonheme iron enzyme [Polyangiaceae bacterium]|nr:SUMF1/EgtB/PvdO family nonheme iron enzyme [Polyangiaceae bacterium]HMR77113.1 SUMF1/EgtB/PvdO family nonheme iron enzyme [Polyangiaceae bacterium]